MKVKSKIDFFWQGSHIIYVVISRFSLNFGISNVQSMVPPFPAPLYFSPFLSAATCNQKMIHISLFGFWLHCYFSHCSALEATNWQVAPWPHRPPLTLAVCVCVCWDFEKFMPLAI